jgi:hypothetical protein
LAFFGPQVDEIGFVIHFKIQWNSPCSPTLIEGSLPSAYAFLRG